MAQKAVEAVAVLGGHIGDEDDFVALNELARPLGGLPSPALIRLAITSVEDICCCGGPPRLRGAEERACQE